MNYDTVIDIKLNKINKIIAEATMVDAASGTTTSPSKREIMLYVYPIMEDWRILRMLVTIFSAIHFPLNGDLAVRGRIYCFQDR